MSVIEDTRKVLQDFIAPELRAITARLDALEKKVDENERRAEKRFNDLSGIIGKLDTDVSGRIEKLDANLSGRIEEYERRAEKRYDDMMSAIRLVIDWSSVQQRLARLESRESKPQ